MLLTIVAAFFEGRLGQFELLVGRPSLQIFEFLELKFRIYYQGGRHGRPVKGGQGTQGLQVEQEGEWRKGIRECMEDLQGERDISKRHRPGVSP